MRAAVMHQFREPLTVTEVTDPAVPQDGVVIELRANGICRSDWHAWMGHDPTLSLPHVPGHELAGVVAEVGPHVSGYQVGERVTVPFCCGCGACTWCRAGQQHLCDHEFQPGFTAWGAFAQYVAIPHADVNLVRLPDGLGFTEAASLGCRFMTAFHAVVDQGRVTAGEWVAVHGCGGVGLSAIMIAAALGARVIGVDIDAAKLERAASLGAAFTVNAQATGPVRAIRELTAGGAHVSLDALGSSRTCRNSIRCLRKRGRHVQVGLMLADERSVAMPMHDVIAKELVIVGSHGMQAHRYDAMLRMITSGLLRPARLIGKEVGLEQAGEELAAMSSFAQQEVSVITTF